MSGYTELRDLIREAAFDADDDMTASEGVTYTPKVGDARPIQVIAKREDPEDWGSASKPMLIVRVLNDETYGITDSELVLNADTITIGLLPGDTPTARLIKKIHLKNAGFMRLELS